MIKKYSFLVLCLLISGCDMLKGTKITPTMKEVGLDVLKNVTISTSTIKGIELLISEMYGIKVGTITVTINTNVTIKALEKQNKAFVEINEFNWNKNIPDNEEY